MKCLKCQSEDIEISPRSVPVERPGSNLRHHHAKCRNCSEILWWNAPPGPDVAVPNVGAHECGFFKSEPG